LPATAYLVAVSDPDTSVAEAMTTAALSVDMRDDRAWRRRAVASARAGMTYAADMARAGVRSPTRGYFHLNDLRRFTHARSDPRTSTSGFSINYETNLVIMTRSHLVRADFLADLEHCVQFSADDYDRDKTSSRRSIRHAAQFTII
jgi:hypothetical protein